MLTTIGASTDEVVNSRRMNLHLLVLPLHRLGTVGTITASWLRQASAMPKLVKLAEVATRTELSLRREEGLRLV
jgi:hypothetical protein